MTVIFKTNFMQVNFTMIKKRPDCEALITIVNQEKEDLGFRKQSLERQRKSTTKNSIVVETELQSVNAEIAAYDSIIAGLPDGRNKEDAIFKKQKLEYKRLLLTKSKNSYGIVSLVEKEFDIGCIDKQIEEADAFITAITEYMNSL